MGQTISNPSRWRVLPASGGLDEVAAVKVFDFLHYGRENAIPSKILAQALGFRSVRARNTIKAAQSAQRALDAATGQNCIEGWYDG